MCWCKPVGSEIIVKLFRFYFFFFLDPEEHTPKNIPNAFQFSPASLGVAISATALFYVIEFPCIVFFFFFFLLRLHYAETTRLRPPQAINNLTLIARPPWGR